ncbi:MAG TPA: carboxypeptidase-like regulatory domain-containing protein, partial [Vicinamibacteria bacterium]|nr:carboxypeptidase-like regulatory domain-containing protein [Vicinamibacteria bacterium]
TLSCVAILLALVAAACGSSSPSSPSGAVSVQGVVLGSSAAGFAASSNRPVAKSGTGTVTVTVAGTNQTVTVSANGTFELTVPAGTFTLVFESNGVQIGTVEITAGAGSQVKITVQVQSSTLTVIEIKVDDQNETDTTKTCAIEGGTVGQGIELEGSVADTGSTAGEFNMTVNGQRSAATVVIDDSHASFKCNGPKTGTCNATSVVKGAKVHVTGTLDSCTMTAAKVTASQVMLQ